MAVSRYDEVLALEREVADLRDRLETRKLLDRAKAMLQATRGMDEAEAFRWIQRTSMDGRTTMRDVAARVVAGEDVTPA